MVGNQHCKMWQGINIIHKTEASEEPHTCQKPCNDCHVNLEEKNTEEKKSKKQSKRGNYKINKLIQRIPCIYPFSKLTHDRSSLHMATLQNPYNENKLHRNLGSNNPSTCISANRQCASKPSFLAWSPHSSKSPHVST
jgi:hypothetical protein